jgi:hypothetical protein
LLEDAIAGRTLPTWFTFLAQNAEPPNTPVDAIVRINSAVRAAWRQHGIDVVEDARNLVLAIVEVSIPEEAEEALRKLVTNQDSVILGESVLLRILRDLGLWHLGEMVKTPVAESNRWNDKISPGLALELKDLWFQTASNMDVGALIESEPTFMSALYRWGQFDSDPFKTVRARLTAYLTSSAAATSFANGFAPRNGISMTIDGVDKLIADMPKFLSLLRQGSPYASVIQRFNEQFGDRNVYGDLR